MVLRWMLIIGLLLLFGYHGNQFAAAEPLNVTYLNDTNSCPSASTATWSNYAVVLETKPDLCFMRVTWTARLKREPVYERSWWGGWDVTYKHSTVYIPFVEFMDKHHLG